MISWAGVAVGALAVAFFSKLGDHAATVVVSPGDPAGPPVRVVLVSVSDQSESGDVYVFRGPLTLTPRQLASLNAIDQSAPSYDTGSASTGR